MLIECYFANFPNPKYEIWKFSLINLRHCCRTIPICPQMFRSNDPCNNNENTFMTLFHSQRFYCICSIEFYLKIYVLYTHKPLTRSCSIALLFKLLTPEWSFPFYARYRKNVMRKCFLNSREQNTFIRLWWDYDSFVRIKPEIKVKLAETKKPNFLCLSTRRGDFSTSNDGGLFLFINTNVWNILFSWVINKYLNWKN